MSSRSATMHPPIAFGMPDELLPAVLPTAVYWIGSGIYSLLSGPMEKHRLFTGEEEDAQNLVTRRQAVVGVLLNQALQMALAAVAFLIYGTSGGAGGHDDHAAGVAPPPLPLLPSLLRLAWQLAVALLIIDTWQYFWHRCVHENEFLYRHVHSIHHRLVVPFAYGAQYMHPVESFFGDALGLILACLISGLSPRASAVLLSFTVLKGLDDHSGMWFPNHPFHRFFTNNSALHASHHQRQGIKHNFSAFYFVIWDKLLGTYVPYSVEVRAGGGYRLRAAGKEQ